MKRGFSYVIDRVKLTDSLGTIFAPIFNWWLKSTMVGQTRPGKLRIADYRSCIVCPMALETHAVKLILTGLANWHQDCWVAPVEAMNRSVADLKTPKQATGG